MADLSSVCCTTSPVTLDYKPVGTFSEIDVGGKKMPIYLTGKGAGGVVLVMDIFGYEFKQTFQVADRIAAAGLCVAVPDVFFGEPWPMSKVPMKPEDDFMGWVGRHSWEGHCKGLVMASVEALKTQGGATKFGCLGFCWGTAIAMAAGAEGSFSCVGGPHPSLFGKDKELASKLQCPVILLPANGDPMESVKEVTDTLPFASKCVYQRFDDQQHGFCAARGEWNDPKVAAGATQAIELMANFCKDNLLA